MFQGFAKLIDAHDDARERIIKISREITKSSKRVIFETHRCLGDTSSLKIKLDQVSRKFAEIATELDYTRFESRFHYILMCLDIMELILQECKNSSKLLSCCISATTRA